MCTIGHELMCPSSWKLYVDYFHFFLAHRQVDIGATNHHQIHTWHGKFPSCWSKCWCSRRQTEIQWGFRLWNWWLRWAIFFSNLLPMQTTDVKIVEKMEKPWWWWLWIMMYQYTDLNRESFSPWSHCLVLLATVFPSWSYTLRVSTWRS